MNSRFILVLIIGCFCISGCTFYVNADTNVNSIDSLNIKPISVLTNTSSVNAIQTNKTVQQPKTSQPVQKVQQPANVPVATKKQASKNTQQSQVNVPSNLSIPPVSFENCSKTFKLDSQRLFYLTLASVNANRFSIDEIQSKSGYVVFTAAKQQFLASVITIDSQRSMLKITPCNNIYYFSIGIVQNIFKYIELNMQTPIENLGICN